AQDIYRASY
nr:Chain C, anapestic lymphoma kinase-derived neuroblastoma tumor antigen [Homo sapiens]